MQATLFGTDGIRKTMGQEPLTTQSLIQLGNALGHWMVQNKKQHVAIAHDTRQSCSLIKSALKTGLLQYSLHVTDAQILPTPLLFDIVAGGSCDVGIMITASHNQHHDNGLKIFTTDHGKTTPEQENKLTTLFHTLPSFSCSYEHLGTEAIAEPALMLFYEHKLSSFFPKKFLQNRTVIIDCANGAFSKIAPTIFKLFGAQVIAIADKPNGKNINLNCGSQHQEQLQKTVLEHKADIGFAFDGDGDRVVMANKDGSVYNGDHILALLLHNPAYKNQTTVVSTIMANQGLQAHLSQHSKTLERTAVGDKNVLRRMQELDCLLGGEPSGHTILRDFNQTSDGLFTALRLAQTVISKGIQTFKNYPQVLINVPVKLKKDLSLHPYADIIEKHKKQLINGRLVVRYSGTEPLLRVMIEDKTQEHAQSIGALLSQELINTLARERE